MDKIIVTIMAASWLNGAMSLANSNSGGFMPALLLWTVSALLLYGIIVIL